MNDAATLRVLLVEDDLDTQANLRDILEIDGHHVDFARSIAETLDRTNWSEYGAILLDRCLADGTAESLLPKLQQLAPKAATIIVTGYGDLDSTITALREGAWDYILKPVNPGALRASLSRIAQMQKSEERALQSERLAAVGEMTAVLIHESRNAFQQFSTAMELLQRRVKDRPDALELIERMQNAQAKIRRLFQDIREYAAPIILNRQRAPLSTVLQSAWDELSTAWSGRTVRFRQEFDGGKARLPGTGNRDTGMAAGDGLTVAVDQDRLQQVFRNIFENSLAACADPVEITVTTQEAPVNGGRGLVVAVRDNGPGLSREQLQRVFDPLFTTKPKGTGLGMAITRRIIEAHGGHIEAASPGGAEFRIALPC